MPNNRCLAVYNQKEKMMFKHILVPTDGSALSGKVVDQAVQVAKALGARITAVHVVGNYRPVVHEGGFYIPEIPELRKLFEEETSGHAKKVLDAVKKVAETAGVDCDAVAMTGDIPYDMIIKQANKAKCDLIMMASHGRKGLQSILLGSETSKVLTHSKIPVLVVR